MGAVPERWADWVSEKSGAPVFGLAGSSNFRFLARYRELGGDFVPVQHEAGAVAMATGWAEAADRVGVASVHQGPGFTNTLTALVDAHRARIPVIVVTGHDLDSMSHQHVDTEGLCDRLGVAYLVPDLISDDVISETMDEAAVNRCPVVLLPPRQISLRSAFTLDYSAEIANEIPDNVIRQIAGARRIAIIAGRGAVRSGALPRIESLADQLGALLVTSAAAHGSFAGNPRYAGSIGGFATAATTEAMRTCDTVIAFGASLDRWSTAGGRMFDECANVIRVDPWTLREDHAGVGVRMDAGKFAEELATIVPARASGSWAIDAANAGRAPRALGTPSLGLDPRQVLRRLDQLVPSHRRIVLDSGHFIALAAMYLTTIDGPHVHFGQDFQSVGLGLAKAIGAALTNDGRITVCVLGDGGAGMSIMELATAVELRIPLLVILINDAAYGAEVHDFAPTGVDVSVAQFTLKNWADIAKVLGAEAKTIRELSDLDAIGSWLDNPAGPFLLDCQVDPTIDATTVMTDEGVAEWSCAE